MHFIMKHMSKKMLSIILALMILVTTVSVAFSAIADAISAPYVVTEGKPSIAMQSGYTLDLNKINVMFGDEEVPGDKIIWSAPESGGLKFNSTDKTVMVFKPDTYTITATNPADPTNPRTIYLTASKDEPSTQVNIYEHSFKAEDLKTDGSGFKDGFEWKMIIDGTGKLEYDNESVGVFEQSDAYSSAYYVLDPKSDYAKAITTFPDITIETTLYPKKTNKNSDDAWYGIYARARYANDEASASPESYIATRYRHPKGSGKNIKSALILDVSRIEGTALTNLPGKQITTNELVNFKLELNGNKMNAYYDLNKGNGYQVTATEADLSATQQTALAATAGNGGTIAIYSDNLARIGINYVRAYIAFAQDELDKIANACTKNEVYTIYANKPAITAISGKAIDLSSMLVEFDDGSFAVASDINWEAKGGCIIDGNVLTIFKSGTHKITATKKNDPTATKNIYLFADETVKNEVALIDYIFSDIDKGTTDENGLYTFGGSDGKLFNLYAPANTAITYAAAQNGGGSIGDNTVASPRIQANTNKGLYAGATENYLVVNPDSAEGSLMTEFADCTIVYRGTIHANFICQNSWAMPVVGKYNMAADATKPDITKDSYVGYKVPFSNNVKGGMLYTEYKSYTASSAIANPYYVQNVTGETIKTVAESDFDFKMEYVGNDFTVSVKGETNADSEYQVLYTTVGDSKVPEALKEIGSQRGTFMVFSKQEPSSSDKSYLNSQKLKVTINFTDEELAALEKYYLSSSSYYIVSANKPGIPMKLNTKVSLNNMVVEMADGTFMKGTDVVWESTNGVLEYNETDNTVAAYRNGNYILLAKKAATDTEARSVYILVNDTLKTDIDIIDYTFKAADAGKTDENGVYAFGGSDGQLWKFYTKPNTTVYYNWVKSDMAVGSWTDDKGTKDDPSDDVKYSAEVNMGINIGGNTGYLVINPESKEGKIMAAFADYTIVYRASPHPNFAGQNRKTAQIMGKYQMVGDTPSLISDTYLGYNAPWSNKVKGGILYTGNKTHVGNAEVYKDYLFDENNKVIEADLDFKMQYKGGNFSFSVKGAEYDDSTYKTLYTMSADEEAPLVAKMAASQTGTFAAYTYSETQLNSQKFKVTVSFSEEDIAKLNATDVDALYNVEQSYPAVPVKQGHKVSLSDLLVQLPNGDFIVGSKLNWNCDYAGSEFFLDNTEKVVYAYGDGRYDVKVTNPADNSEVITVYFIVSSDGIYRLFNHTFTKADLDGLAETGKSDMWIAKTYSSADATVAAGYPSGTAGWPISWTNKTVPLKEGSNAQFDEIKGISLYNNTTNILLLNPEHPDAKVIAKFSDYNIDFTSSARDKAINNAKWPTEGSVGALGRVNFGDDDEFDFMNGKYLNAYMPGSIQNDAYLAMNVGMVINLTTLNVAQVSQESSEYFKGSDYTWALTKETENVVIDAAAQTITAKAPGIYPVTLTKDGVAKTYSIVVANEPMDHHIMGKFGVTKGNSTVNVNAPGGFTSNNYLRFTYNYRNMALTNPFTYNVPDTYNFRVTLNGDNIALKVAPNGTANYSEIFNSATDTKLTASDKSLISSGNLGTGTIGLFSDGSSCAWFKSLSVSLDFETLPKQESLGGCYEEDGRYVYMQVGEILDLTQSNFEAGNKYHNGANITFTNAPDGLTIVNGVSITANKEGVYTLNATATDGTKFTIIVAVSSVGAIFNNGNYKFTQEGGTITSYTRIDANQPYSEYVLFPSELDGVHIYEVGSALAVGNPGNKQLVKLEIEKYIEKIGAGAFIGATKLKDINIPNTVTTIGSSAFSGTTALENMFIPGSVSEIGDYAFQNSTAKIIISNPEAKIGKDAFTVGATICGFAGSTAQKYALDNGIEFVELTGSDKAKAEASYNEWVKYDADRYTKVNETVEWTVTMIPINGIPEYRIMGFKFTDRSAGKFVFPKKLEITNDKGEKETVKVIVTNGAFDNLHDSRAIYTIELEEGHTSIGMWAFRDCYNLRDVILPSTLTSIGQQAFMRCTSLEEIDIPDAVTSIGLYAFEDCRNLKKVNINPETSRLQNMGTNGVKLSETPGRVFYGTQVTEFHFPVTYEWITNSLVNFASFKEVWIYNKDCNFTMDSNQAYYFNKGTIIHGVPGSTAEAIVRDDEALKDHEDPEKRKNYRGLKFVGDIEDFYTTQENVLDTEGKFIAKYVRYEVIDQDNSKVLTAPYYAISGFVGKGGKVVMPAYLDVGDNKNVPIYSISDGFQAEGNPTGGIDRIINLEISEGIAAIENEALSGTNRLKTVKFPSTLLYIGEKAFMGSGLTGKLEIPKNVTEIGRTAFRDNKNLTDVVILNQNLKFGAGVFDTTITIHGIKGSTAEAYAKKNKINFVEIPAPSVPTVSDFSDNGNYKFTVTDGYITGYERLDEGKEFSLKLTIPATIDGVAIKGIKEGTFELGAEATSVFAIEIQDGITEIGKNAFKSLKKLAYIKFPNTLKTIGESAFEETHLAGDITLPESLEKIEKNAFKNLKSIVSITVLGRTTVIEGTAFPRNNPDLIIYGYTGSTAEEWAKNFNLKFEYLDGGPQEEEKEEDFTEDPSESVEDEDGNEVVKIIRQSNLALIIVIAVSMLLFAILLAAVVVVLVIIKKKRDEEAMIA